MSKNRELEKLIQEHKRDKKSFVVYPDLTRKQTANRFSSITVRKLVALMELGNLSDQEKLCFVVINILTWPKLHFSKVIKDMGKSHPAIGNRFKFAERKMRKYFKENKATKIKNPKIKREISDSEEIKEIFDKFSGKQDYFG